VNKSLIEDSGVPLCPAAAAMWAWAASCVGRGLHSSSVQLNMSRF